MKSFFTNQQSIPIQAHQLQNFRNSKESGKRMMTGFNPLKWEVFYEKEITVQIPMTVTPPELAASESSSSTSNGRSIFTLKQKPPPKKRYGSKPKGDEVNMQQAEENIRDSFGFFEAPLSASASAEVEMTDQ
jgi:hypothetical protein